MKEKIKLYGAILILIVFVPYLITVYFQGSSGSLFGGNSDEEDSFEQKVIQMVADEMSGRYETEALKAQAVIARTNLYQNPELTIEGNQENYTENLDKITFCVEETRGEILTCDGKPIDAAYHAVSSKNTRNASEVSGQEEKSYLKSVDSHMDIPSPEYLKISYMEKEEMAEKLQVLLADKDVTIDAESLPDSLVVETRDSADYVTEVRYDSVILNGEAVREALGLPSSCFYFAQLDGKIRITTKGLGHGLGLSQYGANELALQGKSYKDILNYYYNDVEIEKIK